MLEKLVLEHLNFMLDFAKNYENEFAQTVMNDTALNQQNTLKTKKSVLAKSKSRFGELDRLFKKLYEDNFSGKLSDECFAKMSAEYETEQETLKASIATLESEVNFETEKAVNVDSFLRLVQKYTRITELSSTILREFIEKIVIHEREKVGGLKMQRINIHYNFIRYVDVADKEKTAESA